MSNSEYDYWFDKGANTITEIVKITSLVDDDISSFVINTKISKITVKFTKEFDKIAIDFFTRHSLSCDATSDNMELQFFTDNPFKNAIVCTLCKDRVKLEWKI